MLINALANAFVPIFAGLLGYFAGLRGAMATLAAWIVIVHHIG